MNYWLMKSEPEVYSIDALAAEKGKRTCWDGVRNYQARNLLRDRMKRGDLAFFYHSNCVEPGIVGIVEVVREGYPDHTAFDSADPHYDPASNPAKPRWFMVDVKFVRKLDRLIPLAELRRYADTRLRGMQLLKRGNRLSVMPVSKAHWDFVVALQSRKPRK